MASFDMTDIHKTLDDVREEKAELELVSSKEEVTENYHDNISSNEIQSKKNDIYIVNLPDVILSMILSLLSNNDQLNLDNAMTNHYIRDSWVQSFYLFYGKKFGCYHRISGLDGNPRRILQGINPDELIIGNSGKTQSIQIWKMNPPIQCRSSYRLGDIGVLDMIHLIDDRNILLILTERGNILEFNLLTRKFQTTIEFFSFARISFSMNCFIQLSNSFFIFASSKGELIIWDPHSTHKEENEKKLIGHTKKITCLLDLKDSIHGISSCFATGSEDNKIHLWNTLTKECFHTFDQHTNAITSLLYYKVDEDEGGDGFLVSSSLDKTIKVWMLSGYDLLFNLTGHTAGVNCLLQLQDGRLASGSSDKTIRIWDIFSQSSEEPNEIITCKTNLGLLYQLNDGRLVTCYQYGGFSIWDIYSNQKTQQHEEQEQKKDPAVVAPTPSSSSAVVLFSSLSSIDEVQSVLQLSNGKLAIGSQTGSIRIWNLITNQCEKILAGYGNDTWNKRIMYMYQLNEERLAAYCYTTDVKIWDFITGVCVYTLPRCHGFVNLNDNELITIDNGNKLQIWDLNQLITATAAEPKKSLYLIRKPIREITKLASSCSYEIMRLHDGRVMTSSQIGSLSLCDPYTCKMISMGAPCWSFTQLLDGRIVTGGARGIISVWLLTDEATTSTLTRQLTMRVENPPENFGFTSLLEHHPSKRYTTNQHHEHDDYLLAGTTNGMIFYWNLSTQKYERKWRCGTLRSMCKLSDGKFMTGGGDVKIWGSSTDSY